jgi:hypothetical protein
MVASFCLWTRALLRAVEPAHGVHAPFLSMDEHEIPALSTHALRVGGASALAFALAVLRLVGHLGGHGVGGATLKEDKLTIQ